jgi:hypothetical protein
MPTRYTFDLSGVASENRRFGIMDREDQPSTRSEHRLDRVEAFPNILVGMEVR